MSGRPDARNREDVRDDADVLFFFFPIEVPRRSRQQDRRMAGRSFVSIAKDRNRWAVLALS